VVTGVVVVVGAFAVFALAVPAPAALGVGLLVLGMLIPVRMHASQLRVEVNHSTQTLTLASVPFRRNARVSLCGG
jgi:hypothetical protein